MKKTSIIILAAGKGSRMKSNLPKVMHKVAGREMVNMVIDEAQKLDTQKINLVVSAEMENFYDHILNSHSSKNIEFTLQKDRKGTGHAVMCALEQLKMGRFENDKFKPHDHSLESGAKTLILYGDTPLISAKTLQKMLDKIDNFSLCILGFEDDEENAYGRLVIDDHGHLKKIVEYKDANPLERKIALCNSGVIAADSKILPQLVSEIQNKNAANEFYLTDIIEIANNHGLKCSFIKTNIEEVIGVNSRMELANVEKIKQKQLRHHMMENGVTLIAPKTVFFNYDTVIENDVIIHPHVVFGKNVKIAHNCEIKSYCHIEGATIKSNATIGPFARIRPHTQINENVHIGNFVEIKNSNIEQHSKINHLSYIGDSAIGQNTNIGAGTITCNYDGFEKHQTTIGDKVFIGSNCSLIAPLNIGSNALIAAGSVITKNIECADLAISRIEQKNIKDGADKIRRNKNKLKKND